MADKIFVEGLVAQKPREGAPDFVKAGLWVKDVHALIKWLEANHTVAGTINIDIKEGKSGKWYCEKNEWQKAAIAKEPELPSIEYPQDEVNSEDVPF